MRAYRIAREQFQQWAGVYPWDVSPALAQSWIDWMAAEKGGTQSNAPRRAPLAKSTRALKIAAVDSFYEFVRSEYVVQPQDPKALHAFQQLAEQDLVFFTPRGLSLWPPEVANPFDAVQRPQVSPFASVRVMTSDELKAVLAQPNTATVSGKRDFALLLTLAWTCRRSSEVLALKWEDISPDTGGEFLYRYYSRSQKKLRWTGLDKKVYEAIVAYLGASGRLKSMQLNSYLFVLLHPERAFNLHGQAPTEANKPISARTAADVLKKYARRIGLSPEYAQLRGLRYAGIRYRYELMKEAGKVDYESLRDLLDHSNLETTLLYIREVLEDPTTPEEIVAVWKHAGKRHR
ncbi:MAG: site-specific integrase [Anaerolineae bacterium]|nr:site-specific integrase [Anaerolineae bacterium]